MRRWSAAWLVAGAILTAAAPAVAEPREATLREVDRIFEEWRLDARVPGMIYAVVANDRVVAVRGIGVQDIVSNAPVTNDTLFRIASMSKAFTAMAILKLRDEGRLSLDAPVEDYVPEVKGWRYPSGDSRKLRVRDLINHAGGFVTDDPWGDRQQPLSEVDFTTMLRKGVPFARAPGVAMEYSNFGYALLGRVVTNVARRPYQDYIRETIMSPLGMASTGAGHGIDRI